MVSKKTNNKNDGVSSEDEKDLAFDDQENKEENDVNENEKPLLLDKKRILYVEIDDEILDIYHRTQHSRHKNIYLVVPQRATLFQSVINLKILKQKIEADGKSIFLISNDEKGVNLANKVGIPVYQKEDDQGVTRLFSSVEEDDKLKITPLKASFNAVEEENPTRLSERKVSIAQLLNKVKVGDEKIVSPKEENKKKKNAKRVSGVLPNRKSLIAILFASLAILMITIYIALPGATIYITPAASVIDTSVNITLADAQRNSAELRANPESMVATYKIKTTERQELNYKATGKKFSERGANARGTISIINTTTSPWQLIAQTRFQTDEGIVFRISEGVTVPAAGLNGPGRLDARVVADIVDANGLVVGERGNIGPSRFFLPGLNSENQKKIYAESSEPMSGGVTDFITFVSEEDIAAAKNAVTLKLKENVVEKMKSEVAVQDIGDGIRHDFVLLNDNKTIVFSEQRIVVDESVVNQEIEEFAISGEIDVFGIYYDNNDVLRILKKQLEEKKSPQKKLMEISEDSVTYTVFDIDNAADKIKITASIKGLELFDIDENTENGQKLIKKIRERVIGMEIEAAKVYIQNLNEVNNVRIDSWPAWSPTLPKIEDNINFEIVSAVNLR